MHRFGAHVAQHLDDRAEGVTTDDRVINEHHRLAREVLRKRVELNLHTLAETK